MRKTYKQLSALLLALCLILSCIVPAVRAEEALTITYDFSVFGTIVAASGNSLVYNEQATNTELYDKLKAAYDQETLHWYFEKEYAFTHSYGATALMGGGGLGYTRTRMMKDGYIAFTIRNPGEGEWAVSAKYPLSSKGAEVAVYIIPGDTEDIPAALTDKNCLGSYNCLDTTGTAPESPAVGAQVHTTALANWTPRTDGEYKLVLKSLNGEKNDYSLAILSSLSMVRVGDAQEEVPDPIEKIYDFDYINSGLKYGTNALTAMELVSYIDSYYKSGDLDWNYKDLNVSTVYNTPFAAFSGHGYLFSRVLKDDYLAFTLITPGTGTWKLSVDHPVSNLGAKVDVYMLPGNITRLNIPNALTEENYVGSYDCYDETATVEQPPKANNRTTELGEWTSDGEDTHIVVFKCPEGVRADGRHNLYLSQLSLLGIGNNVVPETRPDVGGTGEELPDIEEIVIPEIPDPILTPEIAAEDAVATVQCQHSATSVVNGHDYIYLLFNGGKMLVYDLDTGALVDTKSDVFGTPRSLCVDKNGIVWISGASYYLYRYDPFTLTGEQIPMPEGMFLHDNSFNALGLTSDENGMIYFGTYNRGQLGMYDPIKGEYTNLSGWLDHTPDDGKSPDAQYAAFGGVVVHDGYAYLGIDGDKNSDGTVTHQLIKFDLAQRKIVKTLDITEAVTGVFNYQYLYYMKLINDNVLICSTFQSHVAVDINTMEEVTIEGLDAVSVKGGVSDPIDGKVYFTGSVDNRGLYELDLQTMKVTYTGMEYIGSLRCWAGSVVTVEGDDRLPEKSLVTHRSDSGSDMVNVLFYNPQTKQTVKLEDYSKGLGAGNQLRSPTLSPDGGTVYTGAYQNNKVAVYDVATGKVQKWIRTSSDQTDGQHCYKGYLYTGNYNAGTISKVDPEAGKVIALCSLNDTAFNQLRLHNFASGDDKVFVTGVPYSNRFGGALIWYDLAQDRIYVAGGPDPEDVFYSQAGQDATLPDNVMWYSALTDELADFDDDKDGPDADDSLVDINGNVMQRFTGVIENQCINCIVYKDGYIYGSTTRSNGSGAINEDSVNAMLFVYDVAQMKIIATYDLCDAIKYLTKPVAIVDVIAEDPAAPGKFWGVVSDTLFSFTFDPETGFAVTQELSLGRSAYSYSGNAWNHRDILFDGNYMYVTFGSWGVFMLDKNDLTKLCRITDAVPKGMVLANDGNIYYTDNSEDLMMLRVSALNLVPADAAKAAAVQAMIEAIGTPITLASEDAIAAARAAYQLLSSSEKALVTNLNVLVAAEEALAALKAPSTNPGTGDRSPVILTAMLLISTLALAAVIPMARKKRC